MLIAFSSIPRYIFHDYLKMGWIPVFLSLPGLLVAKPAFSLANDLKNESIETISCVPTKQ
jgi:hypothetical protein